MVATSLLSESQSAVRPSRDDQLPWIATTGQTFEEFQLGPDGRYTQHRGEFFGSGCQELLHPRTLSGVWKYLRLAIAQGGISHLPRIANVAQGLTVTMFGLTGIYALYRYLSPKESRIPDKIDLALVYTTVFGLGFPAVLLVSAAAIAQIAEFTTSVQDRKLFGRCRELAQVIHTEAGERQRVAKKMAKKAISDRPDEMIALPGDIGPGTTAAVKAALSMRGTGEVDQFMAGLSVLVGAGIGRAAISAGAVLARGTATTATRAATAFRATAGAL